MAPLPLLLAGASTWRLGTALTLAAALAGILVTLRLWRAPRSPSPSKAMGLWLHVEELRRRILWSLAAWLGATTAAFSLRLEHRPWGWMPVPALHDNFAAQAYRALADHLVPAGVQLIVLRPLDGFSAEFTVAMALGFAVALPVVLLQIGAFLVPALHAKERRTLRWAVLPALALFALGAAFAYVVLAPLLLETLYGYPSALGAEPFLLVTELVTFAVTLSLVFGLASLTPVAMAGLAAAGLVSWRGFLGAWRHATVAIIVLCALVTDGTIVTLALVAAPLLALYFIGIAAAAWAGKGKPDANEPTP